MMEVEYMVVSDVIKEVILVFIFFKELGYD